MEPLLTAALALGTVIGTKALEKTGEKIGETFVEKTKSFLTNLKQESPTTVTAIEHTPARPLNYSQIIPEIQAAAEKRPELWTQIEDLAKLGQQEPKLMPYIQEAKQWNSQKSIVTEMRDNYGVIAENIDKNVQIHTVQGDVHI
ncbi:hypothetical protein [Aerosakkonema funiforme]|uniref:Uncharacterized protein n=1 Tax=Aerosakkonema funiforme FACHB-1375 TaxID=2949571 RepID=A0A926ZEF3_9CYAN|nr:hypothetical protein [Aerosakkonema funiforme]MBD2179604.1 hypothetical protein [Aerosakkonema funiforme FACHB-1375]